MVTLGTKPLRIFKKQYKYQRFWFQDQLRLSLRTRSSAHAINSWLNSGRIDWHLPISAQARYVRKIASIQGGLGAGGT